MIKLKYSTIDRYRKVATFKTLKGARAWAYKWVGRPEIGSSYAVSGDGVGKIEVIEGTTLRELFEELGDLGLPTKRAEKLWKGD